MAPLAAARPCFALLLLEQPRRFLDLLDRQDFWTEDFLFLDGRPLELGGEPHRLAEQLRGERSSDR